MTAINIVIKIAFFGVFIAFLYVSIDYFRNLVLTNLNIPFMDLLSYLGVIQAIQVLISFSIASFVANNVISYFRSA